MKHYKVALIAFFITAYLTFNSFTFISDSGNFKAIHITSTWEFPQKTGDHLTFTRSPDLIYSKNYEILIEPYPISMDYIKVDSLGHQSPDPMRKSTIEIGYTSFICRKGDKYGMEYTSNSDSTGRIYQVDSLIKDFLHFPSRFYYGRGKGKDSIKVIKDNKNGYLTEIITNRKFSETDPDSSYFYFRKKPLDYSFLITDKRADNMYLYKAVILYNHILKADNINNVPDEQTKFQHSFEIREIEVPDKEKLKYLIKKFNKSILFSKKL